MSVQNPFTETHSDSRTISGVDTDGNGQFQVTFGQLRQIETAADVDAHASGGYVANAVSVSGNTVTFELRASAGTDGNELPLHTNGAGVTDVHARAEGY
jgi:hypothetical protein